jgi:hypothetical protein
MAALRDEVKAYVVPALACFDTPSQVASSVKAEFGLNVSRQQREACDPTKYVGRNLPVKWKTLFEDTRKRFREETADIPIASAPLARWLSEQKHEEHGAYCPGYWSRPPKRWETYS